MKIYSNFKDYYDGAGFCDPTIVYERTARDANPDNFDFDFPQPRLKWIGKEAVEDASEHFILILFCGIAYVGVREYGMRGFAWGADKIRGGDVKYSWLREYKDRESFRSYEGKDVRDINIKYKSPIIVLTRMWRQTAAQINAQLSQYNFASAVDPYSARQQIERFISNDLVVDKQPKVLQDKYRIQAAGFDIKTSFRKDTPPTRKQ